MCDITTSIKIFVINLCVKLPEKKVHVSVLASTTGSEHFLSRTSYGQLIVVLQSFKMVS